MVSFKQVAFLPEPSSPQRKAAYAADAMEGGGRAQTTPSKFKGCVATCCRCPHATTHLPGWRCLPWVAIAQRPHPARPHHPPCRRTARKAVAAHPTAVAAGVLGALMLCCYLLFASQSAFRWGRITQPLVQCWRVHFDCSMGALLLTYSSHLLRLVTPAASRRCRWVQPAPGAALATAPQAPWSSTCMHTQVGEQIRPNLWQLEAGQAVGAGTSGLPWLICVPHLLLLGVVLLGAAHPHTSP